MSKKIVIRSKNNPAKLGKWLNELSENISNNDYMSIIGCQFYNFNLGKDTYQVWLLGNQTRFANIRPNYEVDADAILDEELNLVGGKNENVWRQFNKDLLSKQASKETAEFSEELTVIIPKVETVKFYAERVKEEVDKQSNSGELKDLKSLITDLKKQNSELMFKFDELNKGQNELFKQQVNYQTELREQYNGLSNKLSSINQNIKESEVKVIKKLDKIYSEVMDGIEGILGTIDMDHERIITDLEQVINGGIKKLNSLSVGTYKLLENLIKDKELNLDVIKDYSEFIASAVMSKLVETNIEIKGRNSGGQKMVNSVMYDVNINIDSPFNYMIKEVIVSNQPYDLKIENKFSNQLWKQDSFKEVNGDYSLRFSNPVKMGSNESLVLSLFSPVEGGQETVVILKTEMDILGRKLLMNLVLPRFRVELDSLKQIVIDYALKGAKWFFNAKDQASEIADQLLNQ